MVRKSGIHFLKAKIESGRSRVSGLFLAPFRPGLGSGSGFRSGSELGLGLGI